MRIPTWRIALYVLCVVSCAATAHAETRGLDTAPAESDEALQKRREELRARERLCEQGASLVCMTLGRTALTAVFLELEYARLSYDPIVTTRFGLSAGWGIGARAGVKFWDWIPLQMGLRHASANDSNSFARDLYWCTTEVGGPTTCNDDATSVTSTTGSALMLTETGIEPDLRLGNGWVLSPGVLAGYVNDVMGYSRSINNCSDCQPIDLPVHADGAYLAPSVRITWLTFGLGLRYERYFGSDLANGLSITLDFGVRRKMTLAPVPEDF